MKEQKTFEQISPSRAQRRTVAIFARAKKFRVRRFDGAKLLDKKRKQNSKQYRPPAFARKKITTRVVANTTCYFLGSGKVCVVYFHGGCYSDPPNIFHWRFLLRMAKSGVTVAVPMYNRTPDHTAKEVVPAMTEAYLQLQSQFGAQNTVIMGDSAGGGLALALCESLAVLGNSQPSKLVLLSPWVDVDLEDDYSLLEQTDVVLLKQELQILGKCYRGDLPKRHFWCSPLYGLTDKLPPTFLYVGQAELFYADVLRLQKEIDKTGANILVKSYPLMQHVFMVHPIDEAKILQQEIFQLLK